MEFRWGWRELVKTVRGLQNARTNQGDPRAQELCEGRGGRPGLPVPNSPYGLCDRKATLNEADGVTRGM